MVKIFTICSAAILLIAGVAMTGCKNDEPEQPAKVQTYHVSIQAGKGEANQQNGPHKALGLSGNTLTASWAAGEQVTVRNVTKGADLGSYLEAETDGVQTTISGDVTGTINAGDELELKFLSPDYTNQEGTLEYIEAHCDYAVATVHVTSVTYGSITFVESIADFQNQQAIVKFTLKDGDDPIAATELVVEVEGATYTITPASATSELFVALPGFSGQTVTLTATVGSETYTYTSPSGKTFVDGKYYTITVGLKKKVLGFSIDPTHQIEFAKGNLQYKASEGKWRIATNQYDFVGTYYTYHSFGNTGAWDLPGIGNVYEGDNKCNNTKFDGDGNLRNDTMSADCWIDLFGWNTWNKPLLIDNDNSVFATDQSSFKDWGENEIYDGDVLRPANYWRTLTEDEWKYVVSGRPNAEYLCGAASITVPTPEGDVDAKGLVLLPDDFEKPDDITFHYISDPTSVYPMNPISGGGYTGAYVWPNYIFNLEPYSMDAFWPSITNALNDDKYMFNQNRYTVAQWEELEAAGAVFLPAAGVRWPYPIMHYQGDIQGVRQFDVNFMGMYWTSSYWVDEDASYVLMSYESGHVGFASQPFGTGQSVRLVRDL